MTVLQSTANVPMNTAPAGFDATRDLPEGFLEFFLPLHREFTPRQEKLAYQRREILRRSLAGVRPTHLSTSEARVGNWHVDLPIWCRDQRNQMTGPADDAELCVKMLNSGAPGVMLDLEDSCANYWENHETGVENVLACLHGHLTYFDKKRDKVVSIQPSSTVIFTRARGLHMGQAGILPEHAVSASVFDVARIFFGVNWDALKHPLCFYIPKSESAEEALWWHDLFQTLERSRNLPKGSIKCMALVESHPLAYQIEEFAYNLRDHLIGLNLGRWDYMASLIHFNLHDPAWVLPDRNTIPHDVAFFQNLRTLLPEICHKRGLLAIGGMTALYPSREDADLNTRALAALATDKKNEANCLMDGAWTGHPDQNRIAVDQFPCPNQLKARPLNADRYPDLRPEPIDVGKRTLAGTRAAVRTVIRYRNGVLNGKGASLLDGYMEDLATDRIYRLMIAQRMRHRDSVDIVDERNKPVLHTQQLITRLFDEELERLLRELPTDTDPQVAARYRDARYISEEMIESGEFDPV